MGTLSIVALLHGPDRPGLVARVAGWIFDQGGNILHADQHRDAEENIFFQRVEWSQPGRVSDVPQIAASFKVFSLSVPEESRWWSFQCAATSTFDASLMCWWKAHSKADR